MRTRRTIAIGKPVPPIDIDEAEPARRKDVFPSPGFAPSGEEGASEGLPPGVRLRWFRNLLARRLIVAPSSAMPKPPPGAIVWTDAGMAVDLTDPAIGAAVVSVLPSLRGGPTTLSEPEDGGLAVPTVREAVAGALGAVPETLREGVAAEVEWALGVVGI